MSDLLYQSVAVHFKVSACQFVIREIEESNLLGACMAQCSSVYMQDVSFEVSRDALAQWKLKKSTSRQFARAIGNVSSCSIWPSVGDHPQVTFNPNIHDTFVLANRPSIAVKQAAHAWFTVRNSQPLILVASS